MVPRIHIKIGRIDGPNYIRCGTIKIPPCSKVISALHRPKLGDLLTTTPLESFNRATYKQYFTKHRPSSLKEGWIWEFFLRSGAYFSNKFSQTPTPHSQIIFNEENTCSMNTKCHRYIVFLYIHWFFFLLIQFYYNFAKKVYF